MTSAIYVYFDGKAREAFDFYAKTLGGELVAYMPYKDMPPDAGMPIAESMKETMQDMAMHTCMMAPGLTMMATDAPPGTQDAARGFDIMLSVGSTAEAERIFAAFSEGGNVTMPLEETFWAFRYGKLKDRFGTPWMVAHNKPMPTGN